MISQTIYNNQKSTADYITLNNLKNQGYKYIFLAVGKEESATLSIKGSNLKYVYSANDFLRLSDTKTQELLSNKDACIIGGGNVAIDSARKAKRFCQTSRIIYRRKRENMPANNSEIKEAENENVEFQFQKNVVEVEELSNDEKNIILTLDDGTKIKTDFLIEAIGSKIKESYFDDEIKIEENRISVDENFETNLKNIFAGGDLVNKSQTVANTIKTGFEVAKNIKERIAKTNLST